tara:strand:+ start:4269 stop:4619 length:351 start_codon:yes stop_codon:yes gene_type:complete
MKISKKHLRSIVRESVAFSPMKSRATPQVKRAVENSRQIERLNEMQSPERRQAMILADLDSAIRNVEETAKSMYGLESPGDPGVDHGAELAEDLQLAAEMLDGVFRRLEALFDGQD